MRYALDCAILTLSQHEAWLLKTLQGLQQSTDRLILHSFALSKASETDPWPDPRELLHWSMQLRRFDALILPVNVQSLAWTRKVLSSRDSLSVPVILLCHRVSLLGIKDLLLLGADDFVCTPVVADELRLRCLRALENAPNKAMLESGSWPEAGPASMRLQEPGLSGESFQEAKAKVVSAFEQRYLNSLLQTHQGNISRAARAANKNRRAFWELLRKHEISAAPYKDRAYQVGTAP